MIMSTEYKIYGQEVVVERQEDEGGDVFYDVYVNEDHINPGEPLWQKPTMKDLAKIVKEYDSDDYELTAKDEDAMYAHYLGIQEDDYGPDYY